MNRRDVYAETDRKLRGSIESKRKEIGNSELPIRTNSDLEEAIKTKEYDVLYIDKELFKRLGSADLKKLKARHLSFVMVECPREARSNSFRERLKIGISDVGRVNRISGKEEYIERVAVNVYSAILEIEPKTAEERSLQGKLLRKVNKYIHEIGDGEVSESKSEEIER